ncbi:DUF4221 family protein [Algoriphagus aestuarii]|nr:DUF4221 family protein [Algoriphagus aestuarii]
MSCKSNSGSEDGQIKTLKHSLEKAFTLRLEGVPTKTWMVETKTLNGIEYLFYGDVKSQSQILVYNMDSQKWADTLTFDREGPNGIGKMNGFFVKSLDSIYVSNSFGLKVHLMQGNKKLRSYDLRNGLSSSSPSIIPFTTNNALSGILGNKLFYYGFPDLSTNTPTFYNDALIGQSVNLQSGEVVQGGGYPTQYHNHAWPGVNTIFNDQLVLEDYVIQSYSLDDSISVFDKNFNLIERINIPNNYKKMPINYDGKISEKESERAYFDFWSRGFYSSIFYNEKTQHIYRCFTYSKSNPDDYSDFEEYKKTFIKGYTIFDYKNRKLIGQIEMDAAEQDQFPTLFAGSKGLYISKENPDEPEVDFYLLIWEKFE